MSLQSILKSASRPRHALAHAWRSASSTAATPVSPASVALRSHLRSQLSDIRTAGTYKTERIITSAQQTQITVNARQTLNFCANNYLGLSNDPTIIAHCKQLLDSHGCGLSSVRFICGTQDIHKQLEARLSEYHQREATILYASCFDANAGLFEAMLSAEDAVFSDELNHASIIDGIRLCKAQKHRYGHRNMDDLERQLAGAGGARLKLIVTDGVFSMDGNVAPLPQICELADRYGALVFVDECHATGFFGATGRGTEEYWGLAPGRVDIINSTLGKALGGASGGYTTGPAELVELLRQKSRPYLFSNSLPPAVVAVGLRVMDMLMGESALPEKVRANTLRFRQRMVEAGFVLGGEEHPIAPVMLGDAKLAGVMAEEMLKRGIYVIGFSYPVVPKGKARIRVQISAAHSFADIDKCTDAFVEVGRQLGVIN